MGEIGGMFYVHGGLFFNGLAVLNGLKPVFIDLMMIIQ